MEPRHFETFTEAISYLIQQACLFPFGISGIAIGFRERVDRLDIIQIEMGLHTDSPNKASCRATTGLSSALSDPLFQQTKLGRTLASY